MTTVFVLVKLFVAASVLTIPGGFKLAGLLGGPLVLSFTVLCATYSMILLVECRNVHHAKSGGEVLSFEEL